MTSNSVEVDENDSSSSTIQSHHQVIEKLEQAQQDQLNSVFSLNRQPSDSDHPSLSPTITNTSSSKTTSPITSKFYNSTTFVPTTKSSNPTSNGDSNPNSSSDGKENENQEGEEKDEQDHEIVELRPTWSHKAVKSETQSFFSSSNDKSSSNPNMLNLVQGANGYTQIPGEHVGGEGMGGAARMTPASQGQRGGEFRFKEGLVKLKFDEEAT